MAPRDRAAVKRHVGWSSGLSPCTGTTTIGPLIPNEPAMIDADPSVRSGREENMTEDIAAAIVAA